MLIDRRTPWYKALLILCHPQILALRISIPGQPRAAGPTPRHTTPHPPDPAPPTPPPPRQVSVMEGDLTLEDLGLSPDDQAALAARVHVVIHAASIIELEADVQRTLRGNYLGTKRLLLLAGRMQQLRAVAAVSAAAANVNRPAGSTVDEAIYPLSFGGQEARAAAGAGARAGAGPLARPPPGRPWPVAAAAPTPEHTRTHPVHTPRARQVDHGSLVEDLLGLTPESANVRAQMYLDMWWAGGGCWGALGGAGGRGGRAAARGMRGDAQPSIAGMPLTRRTPPRPRPPGRARRKFPNT